MKPKVAFVVQRYGADVAGGAEAVTRTLARRMADGPWDVEVLTTCAEDYTTWADRYPPGVQRDGAVSVRRFPVAKARDNEPFSKWCGQLERDPRAVSEREARAWMQAQGPDCPALTAWVRAHGDDYAAVVCFTYLYQTSFEALTAAPVGKRIIVPFAHDEWPLQLAIWPAWFAAADRIVYSAEEEQELVESRFPAVVGKGATIGQGFIPPPPGEAARFRERFGIHRDFLLYCGRIDRNKGVDRLIEEHAWVRERDPCAPDLVLIGKDVLNPAPRPGVHNLGFVTEQDKADAIVASLALINPSRLESFSLVLLEAWSLGKPTLCSAHCPVMVGQSRRSGGGLWYEDAYELRAACDQLRSRAPDAETAGRWARNRYDWRRIIAQYDGLIAPARQS